MPDIDRRIAGLRCRDLLFLLAEYTDDELETGEVERVHAHLSGCSHCAKFGKEYGSLVAAIRKYRVTSQMEAAIQARLVLAMEEEWAGDVG